MTTIGPTLETERLLLRVPKRNLPVGQGTRNCDGNIFVIDSYAMMPA